jgi:Integrase core domain
MVLGHSRDAFVGLVGSQDLVTFWACHRAAFAHFGGVPKEILYDRTKTVVRSHVGTERREGERVYHPEALASTHHYGFKLRLCRPYRPQTKGKVESDVSYVRERLLRGHGFTSYEQANREWESWNADIARRRVHGTHGEVVAARAERDLAALLPTPPVPYLVVSRTQRKVARDGLISFEGRRYRVSGAAVGETVELRLGAEEIEARSIATGELYGRHPRRRERIALPDPTERSVSLASVLGELPQVEVHRRSLDAYAEVTGG